MANNDEWLRQLAAANKRGPDLRAALHAPFSVTFLLPGDFTGAAVDAQLRLYPESDGAPRVTFTDSLGAFAAGRTPLTLTLTEAQMENPAIIPPVEPGEGVVSLPYGVQLTPVGAPKELLFAGMFIAIGSVANV